MSISCEEARRISSFSSRYYSDKEYLNFINSTNNEIKKAAERGYFETVSRVEDELIVRDARKHFEDLGFKVKVVARKVRATEYFYLDISWYKSWKERLLEWFGGKC